MNSIQQFINLELEVARWSAALLEPLMPLDVDITSSKFHSVDGV